jgi:putative hydrolase of the HAD superfamily
MIKNIIFDFGDVLVQDRTKDPKFHTITSRLPLRLQKLSHKLATQSETGKIPFSELRKFDKKFLFPNKTVEQIDKYFLGTKILKPWRLAHKLSKNYQIIIFSNHHRGGPEKTGKLKNINVHDFPFVNSALVGMRKPQPAFYKYLLKKFHLVPQECLFIDDRERNLKPAKQLGMHTYHYDQNYPKLVQYLNKSGIQV